MFCTSAVRPSATKTQRSASSVSRQRTRVQPGCRSRSVAHRSTTFKSLKDSNQAIPLFSPTCPAGTLSTAFGFRTSNRISSDRKENRMAATATDSLIHIEQLTKVFYTDEIETHALSGVHLSIARGEYLAMSGPSGCGKSTLLSILGLLDTPTGGQYTLNGKEVANLNFADRSRIRNQEIGFIFQSFNLIGDLTVAENVELPLTYRTGMPSAERKKKVQESLERVNMAHRMRHYPAQLSGGQQQRVAVARALAGSPSILLADEPTGNLDSRNGEAVMELLQELHREGATICMVTHDPRFAKHAQREVHLFDGKVVAEEELKKLLAETSA